MLRFLLASCQEHPNKSITTTQIFSIFSEVIIHQTSKMLPSFSIFSSPKPPPFSVSVSILRKQTKTVAEGSQKVEFKSSKKISQTEIPISYCSYLCLSWTMQRKNKKRWKPPLTTSEFNQNRLTHVHSPQRHCPARTNTHAVPRLLSHDVSLG